MTIAQEYAISEKRFFTEKVYLNLSQNLKDHTSEPILRNEWR